MRLGEVSFVSRGRLLRLKAPIQGCFILPTIFDNYFSLFVDWHATVLCLLFAVLLLRRLLLMWLVRAILLDRVLYRR